MTSKNESYNAPYCGRDGSEKEYYFRYPTYAVEMYNGKIRKGKGWLVLNV